MEMLVIAVVAIVSFAAVLLPLLRRDGGSVADEREFDTGAPPHDALVEDTADPIARGQSTPGAPLADRDEHDVRTHAEAERIERDVLRYRESLRAGTLCARCGEANPPGSAYCSDCGKRLPLADAKEFA
jgi:hypothetical protein